MNIFSTNQCPLISAQQLDDRRVNKMILESAQMISTVLIHRLNYDKVSNKLYLPTHVKHPSTLWAGDSFENFNWLVLWNKSLNTVFKSKSNKDHASYIKIRDYLNSINIDKLALLFSQQNQTEFAIAIDIPIKRKLGLLDRQIQARGTNFNSITKYQMYMNYKWEQEVYYKNYIPKFFNRELPEFMTETLKQKINKNY
jgi:hypothetical protein